MERRSGSWDLGSGSSWPFVIFLLFLCPALVSLAGESQVNLCQWCCFYCCCYRYFFPCCCCLHFPSCLQAISIFVEFQRYLCCRFCSFSCCLPTWYLSFVIYFSIRHLLSFPLFVILLAVHIPDICQFCYKAALFEPEKVHQKCVNLRQKTQKLAKISQFLC